MEALREKIKKLLPHLNEYQKRIFLAAEAEALGRGGNTIISKLSEVSRPTIIQGRKDIKANKAQRDSPLARTRSEGGGRKKLTHKDPAFVFTAPINCTTVSISINGTPCQFIVI